VRPVAPDQLRGISGVGEKKLASYGEALIELVRTDRM
jgi:ATP-dependent DNA helicase RecQ